METFSFGGLIGVIVGIFIWSFLWEYPLELAAKIVAKVRLPFWSSYWLCVGSSFIVALAGMFLSLAFPSTGYGLAVLLAPLVTWGYLSAKLKDSKGGAIGAFPAFLVTLMYFMLTIALIAVLTAVAALLWFVAVGPFQLF